MNAQMLARVLEATKAAGLDSLSPHMVERSSPPQQTHQFSESQRVAQLATHTQATSSPQCTVVPALSGSAGVGNYSQGTFLPNSSSSTQGPQVITSQPAARPPTLTAVSSFHGTPHAPQAHYTTLISAENGSIFNTNSPTGTSGTPPLPSNPVGQRSSPPVNSSTAVSGIVVGTASAMQQLSGTSGVVSAAGSLPTVSTGSALNTCVGTTTTQSGLVGVQGSSGQGLSPPGPAPSGPSTVPGPTAPITGSTSSSISSTFTASNAEKDKTSAFGKLFHYMNEMKKELEVAQKQRREGQLETQRLREKCQQLDDRLAMEHSKSAGLEDRLERAKATQRTLRSQVTANPLC